MNTSIAHEAAIEDISAKSDETIEAIVLNVDELSQVSGGRKVNEYEGQHCVCR